MFSRTQRLMLRPGWPEDGPLPIAADLVILLRTAGSPRLIGGIALPRAGRQGGVDCWIDPAYRGLGFATEACRAVIAMARESLRLEQLSVPAPAAPDGRRLLGKLGFAPGPTRFVLDLAPLPLAA